MRRNGEVTLMSATPSDRENFELWVGGPLETILAHPHAGFIVAMVAFPVLERYLRGKSGAAPDEPAFQAALVEVIPELRSTQAAGTFWSMFRHSLLHYAGFQRPNYGFASSAELVSVSASGEVWMNPQLFGERVLKTVRADFPAYERGKVSLPRVRPMDDGAATNSSYPQYWGTSAPPRRG